MKSNAHGARGSPLVYLDQSDWSYLESGQFPREEEALRLLGSQGVRFVVSPAHLAETRALRRGFQARATFMQSFPGVAFLSEEALSHLADEVAALVEGRALATERQRLQFQNAASPPPATGGRLSSWFLRTAMLIAAERAAQMSRPLVGERKRERERIMDSVARYFGGEEDLLHEELRRRGEPLNLRARLVLYCSRGLTQRIGPTLRAVGWWPPPGLPLDVHFQYVLTSLWPNHISRTTANAAHAYLNWQHHRLELAPCLACQDAVLHHSDYTGKALRRSDAFDALHASYAPRVDVFTCDGNCVGAVTGLRRQLGLTPAIRTRQLASVVRAIQQLTG